RNDGVHAVEWRRTDALGRLAARLARSELELKILRILKREKNHRIARRRNLPARDADNPESFTIKPYLLVKFQPRTPIDDNFIMVARQGSASRYIRRSTDTPDLISDDIEAELAAVMARLHLLICHRSRLGDAAYPLNRLAHVPRKT